MNSSRNTFIAFLLNLCFSFVEFFFGLAFNSSAVLADAVHDLGDAVAIGTSAFLEKFSNKSEDCRYSLGYKRFSLLGAMLTSAILIVGSVIIFVENIPELLNPQPVNYNGMLILGVGAIAVNLVASYVVSRGQSKNEEILSLHFLEDTLGWLAVIIVSIILRFTDWYFLDPLLSLMISGFILSKALPKAWYNLQIFLEAVPQNFDLDHLTEELLALDNVNTVNQLNVWTMDGLENNATLHICLDDLNIWNTTKENVRHYLFHENIHNVTIEIDTSCHEHEGHKRHIIEGSPHHHHRH